MPASAFQRQLVLGAAAVMIVGQLLLRAWASSGAWFYDDDYRLIYEARHSTLSLSYLLRPYDSQFMPMGRLVAHLVSRGDQLQWGRVVVCDLTFLVLAATSAVWMLTTLFGVRPAVLVPLGLYLSVAATMPAFMWWAASLNAMPLQCVLFASVAAWVRYLRSGRRRWLAVTALLFVIGLLAYVKGVLVVGVLVYLALAYFSEGSLLQRLRQAVRRWWTAGVVLAVLLGGFAVYYLTQVPQLFGSGSKVHGARDAALTMFGISLPVGAVGGPWHWDQRNPPVGLVDPPPWGVVLAWVVVLLAVAWCALRRRRTLRSWLLLLGYAGVAYALVATTRAPQLGGVVGREYRYVTDLVPVAVLCLGLATLQLRDAPGSSTPRPTIPRATPGQRPMATVAALACFGGLISSVLYAHAWHGRNAAEQYVRTAAQALQGRGRVDLADQTVPQGVIPHFTPIVHQTRALIPLEVPDARFPDQTSRLVVLDQTGAPHVATLTRGVSSVTAPADGCGYRIGRAPVAVPLSGHAIDIGWWVHVAYLGSGNDTVTVRAGRTTRTVQVRKGLSDLYVRVVGAMDAVTLRLNGGGGMCVNHVDVGQPTPGNPL